MTAPKILAFFWEDAFRRWWRSDRDMQIHQTLESWRGNSLTGSKVWAQRKKMQDELTQKEETEGTAYRKGRTGRGKEEGNPVVLLLRGWAEEEPWRGGCCWWAELWKVGGHAEKGPPGQQFQPTLGSEIRTTLLLQELRGLKESSAWAWGEKKGETSKKKNDPPGSERKNLQPEREVMTESAWNGPLNALNPCQAE